MSNVLPFKRPLDRSEQISKSIFRNIAGGDGVDANLTVGKLLSELPDLSIAEIFTGFALSFKVLHTFERLVVNEKLTSGGAA